MTTDEKIEEFRERKAEIEAKNTEFRAQEAEIIKEYELKRAELEKEYTAKRAAVWAPLEKLAVDYRADLKDWLGITEGERTDLIETVAMIRKVARE